MSVSRSIKPRRWPSLAVAGVMSAALLAGCGTTSTSQADASGGAVSAGLAKAQANIAIAVSGKDSKQPPIAGPAPAKGKSVWMINVGLASAGSARWANGFKQAAQALGWKATVFDGQFQASSWVQGIQEAIAAHADGIVLTAIDCASVKAPLQQARAAGIKVVGLSSADCSDSDAKSPSLFNGSVQYADGGLQPFSKSLGAIQADWMAVATKGKGQIISMTYNQSVQNNWQVQGFNDELKAVCPDCRIIDTVNILATDLYGTAVRQKLEQALLQHPQANGLVVPFDDVMTTSGGSAALAAAGRSSMSVATTGGAAPAAFAEIRNGTGIDALAADSFEWESWASIDTLNRLFAGVPVANSGQATLLIDKGHNDQSTTGYDNPPIDFRAAYRKAWGLG